MKFLSVTVMKPTALYIYNISKCISVPKFSMWVLQRDCHNLSLNADLLNELALRLSEI